jgi:YidC/Oxa1 family membrane protein insertase
MDRQAWIAVTLCVIGFVALQFYNAKHMPPPMPAAVSPTPGATPETQSPATATQPPVSPAPGEIPSPSPVASIPAFAEKSETLRNDDIELRLTNRGAGIGEAVLLRHAMENGQPVILNSTDHTPIGAIIEQPAAPVLPEFAIVRGNDGSVEFDRKTPEGLSIHKKFFFPPSTEKNDNFVAEMDVDFRNDGTQPYNNSGYLVSLGSTQPLHPRDMPSYTRLVWCLDGTAKATDVSWFAAQNYPLVGVQKRAAQPVFQENANGA